MVVSGHLFVDALLRSHSSHQGSADLDEAEGGRGEEGVRV